LATRVRRDASGPTSLARSPRSVSHALAVNRLAGVHALVSTRCPGEFVVVQGVLTAGVVFAVVHTGEHYLVDAVVGVFYALAAWWLLQRLGAVRVLRATAATSV
jgi:hypothetical protein